MQGGKILSAIIVDDEVNAISNLKNLITAYCPTINVIESATGVDSAAILIHELKPDVLFLDISMPRKNGFELLNSLHYFPSVVFVTAYEKYALTAIKASAVDYLLKPVNISELRTVEEKLLRIHSFKRGNGFENYNSTVGNLVSMIQNPGIIRTISLPSNDGYAITDINDILYLEGMNNYTAFHLVARPKIIVSKTLKEFEELLTDSGFIRIHKSNIINISHMKKINMDDNVSVVMADGAVLAVSRRRAAELVEVVKQHKI
jgi:two-component system LytT family response regulator